MGLFNTYDDVRCGNQRITANYLKNMGFKKSNQWGAPRTWGSESEFWEKIIEVEEGYIDATLIYFPPTFKAYVFPFNSNGFSPSNKMIGEINSHLAGTKYDFTAEANCKMDIQFGIDKITKNLKKYLKS